MTINNIKLYITGLLADTSDFFRSRYINNKQPVNAICSVLIVLFILLCILILPSKTDTESVTFGPDSKVTTRTITTVEHGILDVFALYLKIVGGGAVLGAAFFGWKRLEINQEGQITERFTRAIDQLGATHSDGRKNLEVRLGGIYALERIALDSSKDYWAIVEVVTAYVRENTSKLEPLEPTSDIQAVMTIIGRRKSKADVQPLNLGSIVFAGGNLYNTNLAKAFMESANLNHTALMSTDFTKANLNHSSLVGSRFDRALLQGVYLNSANLTDAVLDNANMEKAKLWKANLTDVSGSDVNFRGASLGEANLKNAYLEGSDFSKATFFGTSLDGTELDGVNLHGANLSTANHLTKEQIESAMIDQETKLPDYLMDNPEWYEAQIKRSAQWLSERGQSDPS